MFNKSALLLAVTLALSAFAAPAPEAAASEGVAIPISRRSALTTADGLFDHDKAILRNAATRNKHRQNLINLQKNKGADALPQGARILPLTTVSADVQSRMEKRQAEKLTDEEDSEWLGPISVGTPAQSFTIDFDTGSSDLWLPSSSCSGSACNGKHKFTISASSTAVKKSGTFTIEYQDESTVSGPIYTDTVTVAGVTAKTQYFSPVTSLSSSFAGDPTDGILGLAFPAISNLNANPFFVTANNQGSTKANLFSFYLASSGSELYLGGTDSSKFTGSIEYHPIDTSAGYWTTTGASVSINGATASSNFDAIIDSGTTLVYGPPSVIKTFYSKISGSKVYDSSEGATAGNLLDTESSVPYGALTVPSWVAGLRVPARARTELPCGNRPPQGYCEGTVRHRTFGLYSVPCKSIPTIAFSWGGKSWSMDPDFLNLGTTTSAGTDCVLAIGGTDLGLGNTWLVGDAFMRNAYTVFDFDNESVGFATLA
ncbi:acid protease [Roridomyces roridus]|uniref:Acid protease n=1 Tax=Roridomyces roridus TaxID=1738132 RepID=A0AAD7C8F6_9AGAR|nr:acid protease [Roridomyces roridus]